MTSVFLLKNFQKKRILEGEVSLKEQYILAKNKKKRQHIFSIQTQIRRMKKEMDYQCQERKRNESICHHYRPYRNIKDSKGTL